MRLRRGLWLSSYFVAVVVVVVDVVEYAYTPPPSLREYPNSLPSYAKKG